MKVIKKDGRMQELNSQKIRLTVESASDEAEAPMSSSDIQNVVEDVEDMIKNSGLERIHTSDIQNMVVNSLKKLGFAVVARYYYKNRE